jgi:hypothetical protein
VIDSDLTASNRAIIEARCHGAWVPVLPAGTYWLDASFGGTLTSGPWAPLKTVAGQLPPTGDPWNGSMSNFVPCYKAFDSPEAALVAMRLEGHGIRTKTVGEGALIGYGDLTTGVRGVEVWVPEDRLNEAQELIREHLAEGRDSGAVEALADWTCVKCGESNEGSFALCWKCQELRS